MSAFRYNYAIVCRIPNSFKDSKRNASSNSISLDVARKQLDSLVEILRELGVSVLELPPEENYPNCCFVDDCAVVINGTALICSPGDKSRHGEVAIVRNTLKKELSLKIVEVDKDGAMVEGGDVLWTGKEIFVGLSDRTNEAGAQAVAKAFPEYPTTTLRLPKNTLHLKNLIAVAGPDVLCCATSDKGKKLLKQISELASYRYQLVTADENEDHGCGVMFVNGSLIHPSFDEIPNTYPSLQNKFDSREEVCVSELQKTQGTLSSLVILIGKLKHPKNFPTTL